MKPYAQLATRTQVAHLRAFASAILERYPIDHVGLRLINHEFNTTFRVDASDGRRFALRINVNSNRSIPHLEAETAWVEALAEEELITVPRLQRTIDGEPFVVHENHRLGRPTPAVLYSWLPGRTVGPTPPASRMRALGRLAARLHQHAERWQPPARSLGLFDGPLLDAEDNLRSPHPLLTKEVRGVIESARSEMETAHRSIYDRSVHRGSKPIVIHGDLHGWNLRWHRGAITVFDFDDAGIGLPAQDLAIAAFYIRDSADREAAMLAGYEEVRPLPDMTPVEYEGLIASRSLLLLNELLVTETASDRAMLPDYLATTLNRMRRYLNTGVFRL